MHFRYIIVPFYPWFEKFDNDQAPGRKVKGVNVIFRDFSKENLKKAIVIVQALDRVLGKHIGENIGFFR